MGKLPPLVELRAFEAAARHMSFKRAAAELGVTPTAISHQIKLLEQYCGVRLFLRRPRPLALTQAGSQLFPSIREGLDAFATAIASVRAPGKAQPLKLTTTNAFASRWLVPRLPDWRRAHPRISLEVIGTDAVLDLHGGEADIAIRYAHGPATGPVVSEELFRDRFFPVCSPHLLARGGSVRHISELTAHPLVHCYWSPADAEAPTWQRWFAATTRAGTSDVPGFDKFDHLSFREELHAIEAVIAGQGIAICSDVLVARELDNGDLVKLTDHTLPGYGFYLTHITPHPKQPLIDIFSAWLRRLR